MQDTLITDEFVVKLLSVVDQGLVKGLGEPTPGSMCIEAAVCYAYGLPHSDKPPCVHEAVRSFKIPLNDSNWSSEAVRAKGMRKIAVAQLGSKEIDGVKFVSLLALSTVNHILPPILRQVGLETKAVSCGSALTLGDAARAARAASAAANAGANAAAYAGAYSAAYSGAHAVWAANAAVNAAADAAANAVDAAASAAANAAAYAGAHAVWAANAAAHAAANAATHAAHAAANSAANAAAYSAAANAAARAAAKAAANAANDQVLQMSADLCLQALIECGTEGSKFLHLVKD